MQYCYWDMVHDGCNYFSFWAIFCPFTPLTAQEIKISKKQNKNYWRYHFTYLYQKLWLDDVRFLRYGAWRTDGRKRWHIVVGAPPKKNQYFEQSATLFGMKKNHKTKKRIVNQILWSKLWYIGQIYTIPKFIKEEIEKTIAQLSIWKCGLGILDIDTQ